MNTNIHPLASIIEFTASGMMPMRTGSKYDGCYRIHYTYVLGKMVDSDVICREYDNFKDCKISVDDVDYTIEWDRMSMWFTLHPVK